VRRVAVSITVVGLGVLAIAIAGGFSTAKPQRGRAAPALPSAVLVPPRTVVAALRGEPAVINFWASWCGPCQREAPAIEAFARELRGHARLVGVNWNDTLGGANAFIRRYHWTFPNLRDDDGSVGNAYGLTGLPTTFILDARGRIARRLTGPQSVDDIRRALKPLV
jgi:thiol-disulfide isomerase/thioredoxin